MNNRDPICVKARIQKGEESMAADGVGCMSSKRSKAPMVAFMHSAIVENRTVIKYYICDPMYPLPAYGCTSHT